MSIPGDILTGQVDFSRVDAKRNKVTTTVWYYLSNNGDGSASVHFCDTKELAELMEEVDVSRGYDGWGESSVGSVDLVASSHTHVEDILTPKYAIEEYAYDIEYEIDNEYYHDDRFDIGWKELWETHIPNLIKLEELGKVKNKFD